MWKDSIRNIVVIFQPNILRIVGFYVRHSAIVSKDHLCTVTERLLIKSGLWWHAYGTFFLRKYRQETFGKNHGKNLGTWKFDVKHFPIVEFTILSYRIKVRIMSRTESFSFGNFEISLPRKSLFFYLFDWNYWRFPMSSASPDWNSGFLRPRLKFKLKKKIKAWTWCAITMAKAHEMHTVSFYKHFLHLLSNKSELEMR